MPFIVKAKEIRAKKTSDFGLPPYSAPRRTSHWTLLFRSALCKEGLLEEFVGGGHGLINNNGRGPTKTSLVSGNISQNPSWTYSGPGREFSVACFLFLGYVYTLFHFSVVSVRVCAQNLLNPRETDERIRAGSPSVLIVKGSASPAFVGPTNGPKGFPETRPCLANTGLKKNSANRS